MNLTIRPDWKESGTLNTLLSVLAHRADGYTRMKMRLDEDYGVYEVNHITVEDINGEPTILLFSIPGISCMNSYTFQETIHKITRNVGGNPRVFLVWAGEIIPWRACITRVDGFDTEIHLISKYNALRDIPTLTNSVQ